jgi:outer membrane protein assembly factor BamB
VISLFVVPVLDLGGSLGGATHAPASRPAFVAPAVPFVPAGSGRIYVRRLRDTVVIVGNPVTLKPTELRTAPASRARTTKFDNSGFPATMEPGPEQQLRGGASNNAVRAWPGALAWRTSLPGNARGVLFTTEAVFVATEALNGVAALEPSTGMVKWFTAAPSWVHGDPVVHGDAVIVTYGHLPLDRPPGGVLSLDRRTGAQRWRMNLSAGVMPAPALRGDTLFITAGDGCAMAIDAATGRERWRSCVATTFAMSSPRLGADGLFAGGVDGSLFRWNTSTGATVWRAALGVAGHIGDTPVALGDSLVFTSGVRGVVGRTAFGEMPVSTILRTASRLLGEGRVRNALGLRFVEPIALAIRARDGTIAWRTSLGTDVNVLRNLSGTPVLADGAIFLASPVTRALYRIDSHDGTIVWRASVGSASRGAVTVFDRRVFLTASDSSLRAFDAGTGAALGRCRLDAASSPFAPVVVGRSLLLGTQSTQLSVVPLRRIDAALRLNGSACA